MSVADGFVSGIEGKKRVDHFAKQLVAAIHQQLFAGDSQRHCRSPGWRILSSFGALWHSFYIYVLAVQKASPGWRQNG
jgi:hypothetical protein